jgi:hypothetical protein
VLPFPAGFARVENEQARRAAAGADLMLPTDLRRENAWKLAQRNL